MIAFPRVHSSLYVRGHPLIPPHFPRFARAADLRHPLPTALLHLHAGALLPLFYRLWLVSGTGNANFFYASTLVFALANGAALIDFLRAGLLIAVGKGMEGKDVEYVQK
jgi:hypothetical protein